MDFRFLKELLDEMVACGETPNADCSVYQNHQEIFRYYTGKKDVASGTPLVGDELYISFSMSKMLTCVCALQLFESGAFELDDPLSRYMSEFSEMQMSYGPLNPLTARAIETGQTVGGDAAQEAMGRAQTPITIRHLFSMTAGLDYDLRAKPIWDSIAEGKTSTEAIARALSKTVLGFEPGARFRYSLCHDILGALVEMWSGEKLGDYLERHICKPLGMTETFFGVPKDPERFSRLASIYFRCGEGQYRNIPLVCDYNFTDEYQSGGAGIISSTADYALFLDALACGGVGKTGARILAPETVELMRCNQLEGQALKDFEMGHKGYGYGLGVRTHLSPERSGSPSPVGEFGWGGAAGAFSLVDPEKQLSFTYFQHLRGRDAKYEDLLRDALYRSILVYEKQPSVVD